MKIDAFSIEQSAQTHYSEVQKQTIEITESEVVPTEKKDTLLLGAEAEAKRVESPLFELSDEEKEKSQLLEKVIRM